MEDKKNLIDIESKVEYIDLFIQNFNGLFYTEDESEVMRKYNGYFNHLRELDATILNQEVINNRYMVITNTNSRYDNMIVIFYLKNKTNKVDAWIIRHGDSIEKWKSNSEIVNILFDRLVSTEEKRKILNYIYNRYIEIFQPYIDNKKCLIIYKTNFNYYRVRNIKFNLIDISRFQNKSRLFDECSILTPIEVKWDKISDKFYLKCNVKDMDKNSFSIDKYEKVFELGNDIDEIIKNLSLQNNYILNKFVIDLKKELYDEYRKVKKMLSCKMQLTNSF